jgi:cyclophilin family peptidyl-prolyl cis-trans isomerase
MTLLPRLLLALLAFAASPAGSDQAPELSDERLVLQTQYGDIELAFFNDLAPVTAAHILELGKLGAYNSNHFFRVDKGASTRCRASVAFAISRSRSLAPGFVAQVADVVSGRSVPLSPLQRAEGVKTVPGEFSVVKHTRGILSMGRYDDPDSATSSFSILLGNAPHLDTKYCVFGKMTAGDSVLTAMEGVETRSEGIFVMPRERITILSSYVYSVSSEERGEKGRESRLARCTASLGTCRAQVKSLQVDLHTARAEKLP